MSKITLKEFLKKISARRVKKSQQELGHCYGCGERELLGRIITINGNTERCCNRACIRKYLYPCRYQILYPWLNSPRAKKHHKAGYHNPFTYQKGRLTEPETEPPIHRVSLECPLPLY